MHQGTAATGGSGADIFRLETNSHESAFIEDFQPGEDSLHLVDSNGQFAYSDNPDAYQPPPIRLTETAEGTVVSFMKQGTSSLVELNDDVVLQGVSLKGDSPLTLDDIVIEIGNGVSFTGDQLNVVEVHNFGDDDDTVDLTGGEGVFLANTGAGDDRVGVDMQAGVINLGDGDDTILANVAAYTGAENWIGRSTDEPEYYTTDVPEIFGGDGADVITVTGGQCPSRRGAGRTLLI